MGREIELWLVVAEQMGLPCFEEPKSKSFEEPKAKIKPCLACRMVHEYFVFVSTWLQPADSLGTAFNAVQLAETHGWPELTHADGTKVCLFKVVQRQMLRHLFLDSALPIVELFADIDGEWIAKDKAAQRRLAPNDTWLFELVQTRHHLAAIFHILEGAEQDPATVITPLLLQNLRDQIGLLAIVDQNGIQSKHMSRTFSAPNAINGHVVSSYDLLLMFACTLLALVGLGRAPGVSHVGVPVPSAYILRLSLYRLTNQVWDSDKIA